MEKVSNIAKQVRKIFVEEKDDLNIPFFYSFPKNCCQGASCFFALILQDTCPDKTIMVVHGTDEDEPEHHFWVEVEGLVYDLTADQFENVLYPVYGSQKHPLNHRFLTQKRSFVSTFYTHYCDHCLEYEKSREVHNILKQKIKLGS